MPYSYLNSLPIAAFMLDVQGRVAEWNPACEVLTGLPRKCVLATRNAWQAFYPDPRPVLADLVMREGGEDSFSHHYGDHYWRSAVVAGGYEGEGFFPALGEDGRWLYFSAAPVRDAAGNLLGVIETLQDVTERKRAEEQLRQSEAHFRTLSRQDALTGLLNGRHFKEVLAQEIQRARRYEHPLSLLMIDTDHFKQINDQFGHAAGDIVLRLLAGVLKSALRQTDFAFRVGGDEFVILLPESTLAVAEQTAARLVQVFPEQQQAHALPYPVSTLSIGLATLLPDDTPRSLAERADRALYQAKACGRNNWRAEMPGEEESLQEPQRTDASPTDTALPLLCDRSCCFGTNMVPFKTCFSLSAGLSELGGEASLLKRFTLCRQRDWVTVCLEMPVVTRCDD